jgi:hypothetical protein
VAEEVAAGEAASSLERETEPRIVAIGCPEREITTINTQVEEEEDDEGTVERNDTRSWCARARASFSCHATSHPPTVTELTVLVFVIYVYHRRYED